MDSMGLDLDFPSSPPLIFQNRSFQSSPVQLDGGPRYHVAGYLEDHPS